MDVLLESITVSAAFFWKAAWAFVMGYTISAMIQTFVPKKTLTRSLARPGAKSIVLASAFGSISSSCSFAALSAARALIQKGANLVAAVAFMFASTNLVIELGVLIYLFLGWEYVVAELLGGVVLITVNSTLMQMLPLKKLQKQASKQAGSADQKSHEDDFQALKKIKQASAWSDAATRYFSEWKMVWKEILVGFLLAGAAKTMIPDSFWRWIFLTDAGQGLSPWMVQLENALVAPLVAAMTFIGSMGNIPLAAVLAGSGAGFAGLLAFIYSDLMIPPLVKVNAKYYGWKVALSIAATMYASIVVTALLLNALFLFLNTVPESNVSTGQEQAFQIDYTFYLNLAALTLTGFLYYLKKRKHAGHGDHQGHQHHH